MSVSSASSSSLPPVTNALSRRSANYHPTVWGFHFIQFVSSNPTDEADEMEQIKILKETVREMLVPMKEESFKQLITRVELIDSIQRLGICYHFEDEICEILKQIQNKYVENGILTLEEDLCSVALVFRLLRQKGYQISPDVFNKFKDEHGKFNERIMKDVEGMLSLYEATHIRIQGEDILDEALAFTSSNLKLIMNTHQLSPSLAAKVNQSLKRPLYKNLPRLVARNYISAYENSHFHNKTLLLLAKLDFNMLQKQYQKELGNISKWWKGLDFASKLPFARDRMVEAYFWTLGVYFEPQYSLGRRLLTKVICMTSVIDDIYDVYGTFEELQLFTKAIERWDRKCMDFLPEYMKFCYQALLDVYEEMEQEMAKEGRTFCVTYAKNEMKRLVQAYFTEAKWFNSNYTPTFEEYMSVAQKTCAYCMVTATTFVGMGCIATEKVFHWLNNDPKIINASTKMCRLMDDVVSNEHEQKRGHVASALECYMKEKGVTREDAIVELNEQVMSAWKDINKECLDPIEVPSPFLNVVLNLSRVMEVLYKEKDGYTHSNGSTKNDIAALILNPWPL